MSGDLRAVLDAANHDRMHAKHTARQLAALAAADEPLTAEVPTHDTPSGNSIIRIVALTEDVLRARLRAASRDLAAWTESLTPGQVDAIVRALGFGEAGDE